MALRRVFVANRGEIAVRIIRACEALGLETVIGVSAADRESLGAELADRAVVLGPPPSRKSYLDLNLVVHAAKSTGCDALHPGYGFLSERADLARLCAEQDIAFVGPSADTIERFGDKLMARALAAEVGLALVPGSDQVTTAAEAKLKAKEIGYPVVLKASAGGGGRGMFMAADPEAIDASFERAATEAREAFGDGTLYLERFVSHARHVEVQIMGDGEGGVVHFGERDCSTQRRYQKVVEEAPALALSDEVRGALHEAACELVRHLRYRNAGTVEFLYDIERATFYFIEVNARIQVEHPVTEAVTGFDLVQAQLRVAAGEGIGVTQSDIHVRGHAIECRINAEDPARDFAPSPGRITDWRPPTSDGIRLDSHCRHNYFVPPFYDSMIGKLIAFGPDRPTARARMGAALADFRIGGIATNLPFQVALVGDPDFAQNHISTRWLEDSFLSSYVGD